VGEWPFPVTLTDANSMAGQSLSALNSVDIEVQVSQNGQPGLANAVLSGSASNVSLGDSVETVVVLTP
jgi:cytochrome c-type biogenesis protein CcmH